MKIDSTSRNAIQITLLCDRLFDSVMGSLTDWSSSLESRKPLFFYSLYLRSDGLIRLRIVTLGEPL